MTEDAVTGLEARDVGAGGGHGAGKVLAEDSRVVEGETSGSLQAAIDRVDGYSVVADKDFIVRGLVDWGGFYFERVGFCGSDPRGGVGGG